ncbi:MAG: nitrile hydratase accessory protein [Pseudomonadota bacterium]
MNGPDLRKIPGITLDGDEPVFKEPWEAQAFAMAVRLHEKGVFEWSEWAETLGAVIAKGDGTRPYYEMWFEALELIVSLKTPIDAAAIEKRKEEWQAALVATPHGKPVDLRNS